MRLHVILLLALVTSPDALVRQGQAPSVAPAPFPGLRVLSIARQDGSQLIWEVLRERYEALPQWNPNGGQPPPLALADAMNAARAWLKERAPAAAEWPAVQTRVQPAARSGFYPLVFAPQATVAGRVPTASDAGTMTVVVLFDGSVVEPRVAPFTPPSPVAGTTDVYEARGSVVPPARFKGRFPGTRPQR
jgi:hypothetical protein